jgi:hypothetical protein
MRKTLLLLSIVALMLAPATGLADRKNIQQPFPSAARTATATSSVYTVRDVDWLVAYLTVTASSGTSPTLDVKVQDTSDGGTTWFDVTGAVFTQVTGSSSSQTVTATRKFGPKFRVVATIAGATPSFTFHVEVMTY